MFNQFLPIELKSMKTFSFSDFYTINRDYDCHLGEEAMRKRLRSMVQRGEVIRAGRNAYCVPEKKVVVYQHNYSEDACIIAGTIQKSFPLVEFTIFELNQLNEFVNHQIAHNILLVSVDDDVADFVFGLLKEHYPGKVLLNPSLELYHRYWIDGMIIINKRITESPKGTQINWHTRLEKLLVDLVSDPLIQGIVSVSEYPSIFESVFGSYAIDESCLFRYAKRRGAELRLRNFIRTKTNILLRTEQ